MVYSTQYIRYTVLHKVYTLHQVTLQYQLYSTILTYRTVTFVTILYTHAYHLKYITVHCTPGTTVQLLNSIHSWGTVHSTFVHSSLLSQLISHSTLQPSPRLSGCLSSPQLEADRERKREEEGGGGSISRRKLRTSSSLRCTVHTVPIHNTLQVYI